MSKYLLALLAPLALSACSETKADACATSEQGQKACKGRVVETCDGKSYVPSVDCNAQGLVCLPTPSVDCYAPLAAGATCNTTAECASPLECAIPYGFTAGTCEDICLPSASTPGCSTAGQVCANMNGYFGMCVDTVTGGQLCFDNVQCPTTAPDCDWLRTETLGQVEVPVGACADNCAFSEINQGQGSCPSGFDCLMSPFGLEFEYPTSGVLCARDTDCNTSLGFTCTQYNLYYAFCARPLAVCGHVLPMYGALPDTTAAGFDPTTMCSVGAAVPMSDYRNYCGVSDPTATVRPYCLQLSASDSFAGVCVAPCVAAADCGTGYSCTIPSSTNAPLWTLEPGTTTTYLSCDPAGPDVCDTGYACQAVMLASGSTYNYCAKPKPVCTPL